MFFLLWLFLRLTSVDGFLLDNHNANSGNKTVTGNTPNQYITVDRFLQFESQQHVNFEQLRNIIQETFGLLSSQLNDQLKQLDAKINRNNSLDVGLQHKNDLLEGNFTDIKRQLSETHKKYASLEGNFANIQRQLSETRVKNTLLESNFTDIQRELSETQDKNRKLQEKLDELMAKEAGLEKKMAILEASTGVQSQLNTSRLSERVTNVEAKTLQLQQNQIARGQDFLAMYNNTIHLNKKIGIFENQFTMFANSTTDQFELLKVTDKLLEKKLEAADNSTHRQIDQLDAKDKLLDSRLTTSFSNVSSQIKEISRKVALTACSSTRNQNEHTGYIVKFETIKTSVGITSTSSFVSTGKFQCEYGGVYLVSADITAWNTMIDYYIMVNGNYYERVLENDNKVFYQKGVISVTLDLHKGDNIWIQLQNDMYVQAYSCLTIVKIK